jgi:hypothetical protein
MNGDHTAEERDEAIRGTLKGIWLNTMTENILTVFLP